MTRLPIAALVAALALASPAFAVSGGEGNNTGCQGQGNPNSPCAPGGTGTPGTQGTIGGLGGAGGAGGLGGLGGRGGDARSRSRSTSSANGGVVNNTVSVTSPAGAVAPGGADRNSTTTSLAVTGTRSAPGVFVGGANPPLCGAGFSAGGSNINGTGALGFSWETESCRKDRLAARLAALGRQDAGLALLCTMPEVRDALAATGTPCGGATPQPVYVEILAGVRPPPPAPRPAYCALVPGIANPECITP
jgi:hypothetical protein